MTSLFLRIWIIVYAANVFPATMKIKDGCHRNWWEWSDWESDDVYNILQVFIKCRLAGFSQYLKGEIRKDPGSGKPAHFWPAGIYRRCFASFPGCSAMAAVSIIIVLKNKVGFLQTYLAVDWCSVVSFKLIFCSSLSNPAIVLVKQAVFLPLFSRTVYCLLNRYFCSPISTDLTRIEFH